MHACPVDAIVVNKLTGSKDVLEDVCVGCKVCTIACPFGTVNYNADTGKVMKCDLCGGDPACAKRMPDRRHHLRRRGAARAWIACGPGPRKAWTRTARNPKPENGGLQIMAWTRNVLRVNLTSGTCTPEPLNMDWAKRYLGQRGLASKYSERRDRSRGRRAFRGQQADHGHRSADRHHGLDRRPLFRGDQEPAHRRHCLLELRRLHRRRDEDRRLGHDHLRGQVAEAGVPATWRTTSRAACRRDDLWGKSVWECDEILHKTIRTRDLRIACVGRAAEAGCLYSAVVNDCIARRAAPASVR